MAWTLLIVAGLCEVGWAIGLKYTEGFTRLWPTAATFAGMIVSFGCLSWAIRTIPLGTGYAVWTGIGAAGTAIIGMMLFKEPAATGRIVSLALVVAGIVGLKLFGGGE